MSWEGLSTQLQESTGEPLRGSTDISLMAIGREWETSIPKHFKEEKHESKWRWFWVLSLNLLLKLLGEFRIFLFAFWFSLFGFTTLTELLLCTPAWCWGHKREEPQGSYSPTGETDTYRNMHNYRRSYNPENDHFYRGMWGVRGDRIGHGDKERLHRQGISEQGLES